MAPKVKMTYFGVHGKGELIRLVLHAAKVEFEDKRISADEWKDLKPKTPFGQIPIVTWDGVEMTQSNAIVRFIAKKYGLAGRTEEDFYHADMILEHASDFLHAIIPIRFTDDKSVKQSKAETFLQKTVPSWLAGAEKILKSRGGVWYAANEMTFADLAMQQMLFWLVWKEERAFKDVTGCDARFTILDNYPLVKKNYEAVMNVPEIKQYLENRPPNLMPGL